jgi:hypothetical protein
MHDLVADYWWVLIFSVPGLGIAIKLVAERAALIDSLSASLRRKLSTLDYSFQGHWVVTATLRDGRRFSRVVINDRFQLVSEATLPLQLRHVEDVIWEGFAGALEGPVVQLSEGRSGATAYGTAPVDPHDQ